LCLSSSAAQFTILILQYQARKVVKREKLYYFPIDLFTRKCLTLLSNMAPWRVVFVSSGCIRRVDYHIRLTSSQRSGSGSLTRSPFDRPRGGQDVWLPASGDVYDTLVLSRPLSTAISWRRDELANLSQWLSFWLLWKTPSEGASSLKQLSLTSTIPYWAARLIVSQSESQTSHINVFDHGTWQLVVSQRRRGMKSSSVRGDLFGAEFSSAACH